jgi:hypothetical protein
VSAGALAAREGMHSFRKTIATSAPRAANPRVVFMDCSPVFVEADPQFLLHRASQTSVARIALTCRSLPSLGNGKSMVPSERHGHGDVASAATVRNNSRPAVDHAVPHHARGLEPIIARLQRRARKTIAQRFESHFATSRLPMLIA